MKKFIIIFLSIFISCISVSAYETMSEIIENTLKVRENAYCPYSNYPVGAALITKSGKVYYGVNIENATYTPTIHAECSAIATAITDGEMEFEIVIVAARGGAYPCGICRQTLNEFNPNIQVIIVDENAVIKNQCYLNDLFPESFGPQNLQKK